MALRYGLVIVMKGNLCKICLWNCKQNVKECPFFNENENIPVLGTITPEGFYPSLTSRERVVNIDIRNGRRAEVIEDLRRLMESESIVVPRGADFIGRDEVGTDFDTDSVYVTQNPTVSIGGQTFPVESVSLNISRHDNDVEEET